MNHCGASSRIRLQDECLRRSHPLVEFLRRREQRSILVGLDQSRDRLKGSDGVASGDGLFEPVEAGQDLA